MSVERNMPDEYYRRVFGTHDHISPESLPHLCIDYSVREKSIGILGKNPALTVPFVIRRLADLYLPINGGSIKVGAVPTTEFNEREPIPSAGGWEENVDRTRTMRDTHPAYNTLVLTKRPVLGPFIIVQEGFTVSSAQFPHVEVTRYELALVSNNQGMYPYDSGIRIAGRRTGTPHQHITDAFGDWSRLDLTPEQIDRAQLPKCSRTCEFRLPSQHEASRLATLLAMCLEQNPLEYPMIPLE